jgi:hypothetical protein
MLTNGRHAMVRRSVASFRAQTYKAKRLLIFESAVDCQRDTPYGEAEATTVHVPDMNGKTIGALRNAANWCAVDHFGSGLIAHWDSDDWSHPRRLEEQVALLDATNFPCVGYSQAVFWETRPPYVAGRSWIYKAPDNFPIGASMCYRREFWQQRPFADAPHEDRRWWMDNEAGRNFLGVSAINPQTVVKTIDAAQKTYRTEAYQTQIEDLKCPRIVCGIHGANTESYDRGLMDRGGVWRQDCQYDDYARKVMAL